MDATLIKDKIFFETNVSLLNYSFSSSLSLWFALSLAEQPPLWNIHKHTHRCTHSWNYNGRQLKKYDPIYKYLLSPEYSSKMQGKQHLPSRTLGLQKECGLGSCSSLVLNTGLLLPQLWAIRHFAHILWASVSTPVRWYDNIDRATNCLCLSWTEKVPETQKFQL